MVRLLERNGAKVDTRNNHRETALHKAVWRSKLAVINYLIYGGGPAQPKRASNPNPNPAFVNAQNRNGEAALHIAAANGDIDAVDAILGSKVADAALRDNRGRTAARIAEEGDCGETPMVFVAHNANV